MPASYPFDTTGLAASNLITNELHTLTEINSNTHRIFIPAFAPFYPDNLVVTHVAEDNSTTVLQSDVDYHLCLLYIAGSRSVGKMLYGGISLNNDLINGTVRLTYQTLGGTWTADANYVLNVLAELVYNPRLTVWDLVTNVQEIFPPTNHDVALDYVTGFTDLLAKLEEIRLAILAAAGTEPSALITHLADTANAHGVTATQVGLGSVANLPLASDAEVATQTPAMKYITLAQVIALLAGTNSLTDAEW